jgi:hypothetical protein
MPALWNSRQSRQRGIQLPSRSPAELYQRKVISTVPQDAKHKYSKMPYPELSRKAPAEAGTPPSQEEILQSLKDHLQVAMLIELSTIPVYLYPYYSVKDVNHPSAVATRGACIT